tara:strand:+ start:345 stop:1238 length:894 start_codon:yes stop_codon:yes gene_type:complete
MAVAAWSAGTAFSVGDIRRRITSDGTGLWFRCTTAGTSGGSEPNFPNSVGDTVTDGTCVWTAIASAYEDLAEISPSAIIELFELRLDATLHGSSDVYRFHAGANAAVTGDIVFNGQTYERLPIQAEGFEYTNAGTLPRPTLTVSNLGSEITAIMLAVNATTAGNDLGGAEVRRIRTLKKYLDGESTADPNAQFPQEIWFVDRKANETRDFVSFELASKFDLAGQKIPRRQVIANICQWKYRSAECSYTGSSYFDVNGKSVSTLAEDVCGKRVASCKLRFGDNGELPFGSFPGAGLTK